MARRPFGEVTFEGAKTPVPKDGLVWGIFTGTANGRPGFVLRQGVAVYLVCFCREIISDLEDKTFPRRNAGYELSGRRNIHLSIKVNTMSYATFFGLQGHEVSVLKAPKKNFPTCEKGVHWSLDWVYKAKDEKRSHFLLHQVGDPVKRHKGKGWIVELKMAREV